MARRGNGEGSIYQRTDGRWVASITGEGNKRKELYGKTRKEVFEKLKKTQQEHQQGVLVTGPQQTMKQYLEHWLDEVHKPTIRLSSYTKYKGLLRRHIVPVIGHIPIQKITPQHVQALYSEKLKEGLTARSIHSIHSILHKALDNAVRWGLVARNVCDVVSQPRPLQHEIQPLTKDQAVQLLEAVKAHRLEALLITALATGMRRGELLSLRWSDISFEKRSLQVCRTMSRISGHGYVESETKTAKGRRQILLPQFVVESLKQHRTRQLEARLKAGKVWQERNLVFCNQKGEFLDPSNLLKMFHKLLAKAGLPDVRFHDLRHSAATILLNLGVHPKVVQELLGHSQIGMTMDIYSHVLPTMQRAAMDSWDRTFGAQS